MRAKVLIAAATLAAFTPALADEGMWTFDNFPSEAVKQKYSVTIDQVWLDRVQAGAVRLAGGCSASLVSAEGLVLTNHHCVAGCVQDLSTAQQDYIKNGFIPASRGNERQCPGAQAEILTTIADVTPDVNRATAGKSGPDFVRSRDSALADLEKRACEGREAINRCQVITFYDGGQYKLYTYRKYTDVRLAFAPEAQAAFFGGDPDNFNFPRYDLDFSFLRLYENGRPVSTPQHLKWNASAPKEGDLVFVAGNPGGTDRLLTAPQLVTTRDVVRPPLLYQLSELRGRYARFAEESPEHARIASRSLFGIENTIKVLRGAQLALLDPTLIESKRKIDAELKARVDADPRLKAEIGDPWAEIAQAQIARAELNTAYSFLEGRAGSGSQLFGYARRLVRAAAERAKPNGERLREYTDGRLPLLEKTLLDPEPVERDLEQLRLQYWLTKLREELTADAPETQLYIGQESPELLARTLSASKLGDAALRKQLWDGGERAIRASNDPMIRYVLKTDESARAVRKAYEERVDGPTDAAAERIAKARFAAYGTSVYPDATFSLRLSYGRVAGWTYRGRVVPATTDFDGLYRRVTGHFPFDLPQRWMAAKGKLDLSTVYNISSENDIIGGNSGSPLINARGEVIGAIFDGNIHSLGGDFFYDPALNRAVSVSTAAITEALNKVYGQTSLVAELNR